MKGEVDRLKGFRLKVGIQSPTFQKLQPEPLQPFPPPMNFDTRS